MTPRVFLHGFLGSPAEWGPIMRRLSAPGCHAALALPPAPDWATGLSRMKERLPAEYVLIGYSLGARVALGVALACPSRVRGLCLISGHPGLDPSAREARRRHDHCVAQRMLVEPWAEFLDDWYRQEVFASVDDATRDRWVRQKVSLNREYHADLLRGYSIAGQPEYWLQLPLVADRTLVVVGQEDRKYVEVAGRMQRHAPKLRLEVVPATGHAVHRERPDVCGDILQAFLATLPVEKT
jgi:2-succinyl-6-hydroxy-2,4-cyclohexadiene-1-carboxylate synthase